MYRHISEGNWENYDPFEIDYRLEASMTSTSKGYSFFKAFQGWLSFSSSGPNDGTLKVFPNLKEATAFWYSQPLNHTNGNGNKKDYFSSVIFSISILWKVWIYPDKYINFLHFFSLCSRIN